MPNIDRVILVAEAAETPFDEISIYDFDADKPSKTEISEILDALSDRFEASFVPLRDLDLKVLTKDDIVFPLWQGGISRNRTSIVPAMCEHHGIKCVGADAYVHGVCQDKHFSKSVAQGFGIDVPKGILILSPEEINHGELDFPLVAKPIYGGSSIGISSENLCYDEDQLRSVVKAIFSRNLGPVSIEEFVQGEEFYLSLMIKDGKIQNHQMVKWLTQTGESFLHDKIFDFDLKVKWEEELIMTDCTSDIPPSLISCLTTLCEFFAPIDILRCDFRGPIGNLKLIELTPDMNLAFDAEFVGGFNLRGQSISDIFEEIIHCTLSKYQDR